MERLSDAEDFVPPTPKNQIKPFLVLGSSSTSITNVKTTKVHKMSDKTFKRKKISGISPDFKKFKERAKQVTLFSYLKKDQLLTGKKPDSKSDSLSSHRVKVKLFSDLKSTGIVSSKCNTTERPYVENIIDCNVDCSLLNSEVNLNSNLFTKNNATNSQTANSNIPTAENMIDCNTNCSLLNSSEANLNSNFYAKNIASTSRITKEEVDCNTKTHVLKTVSSEICQDIKNLTLEFDDRSKITDYVLSDQVMQASCNSIPKPNEMELPCGVNKSVTDTEQSFLWLEDVDWKSCDNFIENEISSFKKSYSTEIKTLSLESSVEDRILFEVKDINRNTSNEIHLSLRIPNSISDDVRTCILKGFWADSLVNIGDTVHVLKEFENKQAIVDNHSGFLVINPDFLLSSTAVVSTLFCMRKAALNHILPNWSSGNNVMMIGNLVHDIFQQAVNSHASTIKEISMIFEKVLKKQENLICLSCQETSEAEIREKVNEYLPSIANWIQRHCAFGGKVASENLQVTYVQGIEDNVWCPKYGIKGKIDLTVKALFRDQAITKVMPLELKTGRPSYSAEHIGQINLYTLMMEERTKELSDGLLLYLKDVSNMKQVAANHNTRRGLIQLRNELAFYTRKWISKSHGKNDDIENCHLPKPINNKKFCGKCPYLLPCTVYQRAFSENKLLEKDHAMNSLITPATSHLNANHLEYFIHWSNLLLLESTGAVVSNAFWLEEATNRETKGMCLSWLTLDEHSRKNQEVDGIFYINSFHRSSESPLTSNLTSIGLRVGDYVAISNQLNFDEIAVAMGYVVKIHDKFTEVATESDLSKVSQYKDYIFRIDKQVSNSASACIRNNLMRLMDNENQSSRLRNFLIDKQAPNFAKSLPKDVILLGRPILKALNKIQQRVILKSLMAEDYFIIKGMPGTGKTSTIVALVRLLTTMGISVLLTSYTHSAIDNILLKLKEHMEFVRIGQEGRIHPNLKRFSFETLTKDFTTADQFRVFMKKQMVVATTCLGVNHAIFKVRKFDVCIVDEASQINQIACIGPLFHAKKFILVGDDKQLPPLVVNEKARERGMQESLLQRLCSTDNCMELVIQYRMNKEIMRLCNELTYSGVLQCGSESISQAVLKLDEQNAIQSTPDWVLSVMKSDLPKSVMFLNTDQIDNSEKNNGQEKNGFEADLVTILLHFLLEHKVPESNIGIITPYRRQVDLIEGKLKNLKLNEIEVNTVDQYQGRDKEIIIISCVKTNKSTPDYVKKGVILDDEKRLNVAISRAKRKLIIIGCKSSLLLFRPFEKLLKCLNGEQILNLPANYSAPKESL